MMSREGNQDTLNIVCLLKPRDANAIASLMLKSKLEIVRRVLRNLKTGQHENKRNISEGVMTLTVKIIHERTGHATYYPKCEACLKVRGTGTHPRTAVAEASYVGCATVKNCQQGAEIKILVGAGPRGEAFARAVHRNGAKFEDLEQFLKVLQAQRGKLPVYCDQEECLFTAQPRDWDCLHE